MSEKSLEELLKLAEEGLKNFSSEKQIRKTGPGSKKMKEEIRNEIYMYMQVGGMRRGTIPVRDVTLYNLYVKWSSAPTTFETFKDIMSETIATKSKITKAGQERSYFLFTDRFWDIKQNILRYIDDKLEQEENS